MSRKHRDLTSFRFPTDSEHLALEPLPGGGFKAHADIATPLGKVPTDPYAAVPTREELLKEIDPRDWAKIPGLYAYLSLLEAQVQSLREDVTFLQNRTAGLP